MTMSLHSASIVLLCCYSVSTANFTTPKKPILRLVSLLSLNQTTWTRKAPDYIIDTDRSESFAKFKGVVKEYYTWMAPNPSVGKPWPKPMIMRPSKMIYLFADNPIFILEGLQCPLIKLTINRYKNKIFRSRKVTHVLLKNVPGKIITCSSTIRCNIDVIQIFVKKCSKNDWPSAEMNESYSLRVSSKKILITTQSVWGLLRALETLSHLVYCVISSHTHMLAINQVEIIDEPRFSYRGLLLDTSRHFIPFEDIISILKGMEMNKLNVLHWHLTDDQSFSFVSKLHPELHQKGAYDPLMTYGVSMIGRIVQYARERGIRVIPEIDVPGHTDSWSKSHPELMSVCMEADYRITAFGPLNPIFTETYALLNDIIVDLVSIFPDKYIHIGMDEVGFRCWESDPTIKWYMKQNMANSDDLISFFIEQFQKIITTQFPEKIMVVWQEAFERHAHLARNTVIQIWKNKLNNLDHFQKSAFPLIYSSDFYLDRITYGPPWVDFYRNSFGNVQRDHFIGGEACMWNEYQSRETVQQTIWPAACAIAEKLWYSSTESILMVGSRLEEHRCRMLRENLEVGVAGGPSECQYMYHGSDLFNHLENMTMEIRSAEIYSTFKYYITFLSGIFIGYVMHCYNFKSRRYVKLIFGLCTMMVAFYLWLIIHNLLF